MTWKRRGTRSEEIRGEIGAAEWARRRRAVLARDRVCQWPLPSGRGVCGAPATEVDHRVDRSSHRVEDLQGLCSRHHARKTQKEAAQGRAEAAARRRTRRTP